MPKELTPNIEIVYMPSGPEPGNYDERTRWYMFVSIHDPDDECKVDPAMTNWQYMVRARKIFDSPHHLGAQ